MSFPLYVAIYLLFPTHHLQNMVHQTKTWTDNVENTKVKACNIINSEELGDFKVVKKDPQTKLKKECVNDLILEKNGKKYCISGKGYDIIKCKNEGK